MISTAQISKHLRRWLGGSGLNHRAVLQRSPMT